MPRYILSFVNIIAIAVLSLISMRGAAEETGAVSLSVSTEDDVKAQGETKTGEPNHRSLNLHLALGGAFALGEELEDAHFQDIGAQLNIGFDISLVELLAFSVLSGYNSYIENEDDKSTLQDLFIGAGFRFRMLVDRNGALTEEGGNAWGNLWMDAHLAYHYYNSDHNMGFNVGLGYEFSIAKDFNLGPYARFQYTPWGGDLEYAMFAFGVQMSFGGKLEPDDQDKDGIADESDNCPGSAEDKDGYEDEDGCPDADNDGDEILDTDDKCPDQAGVPDENGCPDTDNDDDGILNEADKCPDEAEDKDSFEDEDGCPDIDNDQDGVLDADDKCLSEPEDKDGFEDEDGCPDTDNDGDGVLDEKDECPNEPETKDGKDDEDGCPDFVRIVGSQIKILQKVFFATKKATILKRSHPMLEEVAKIIKLKKDIKVRIEGHTDDRGKDKKNLKLSNQRAESVKKFLVERGIEDERLVCEGLGESKPIADNKTKAGRDQNRRVEFYVIDPNEKTQAEEPETVKEEQAPEKKEPVKKQTPAKKEPAKKEPAKKKAPVKKEPAKKQASEKKEPAKNQAPEKK
ncbi:MAG: OmpA family protein [Proteobacteria bacterium]|nr:OmpA family protein [Pseudomonadota bacterium]